MQHTYTNTHANMQEEIFCVSYVASYYLKHSLQYQGKVYLMGQEGFCLELERAGMTVTGPGPDPIQGDAADWAKTPIDPEVRQNAWSLNGRLADLGKDTNIASPLS